MNHGVETPMVPLWPLQDTRGISRVLSQAVRTEAAWPGCRDSNNAIAVRDFGAGGNAASPPDYAPGLIGLEAATGDGLAGET